MYNDHNMVELQLRNLGESINVFQLTETEFQNIFNDGSRKIMLDDYLNDGVLAFAMKDGKIAINHKGQCFIVINQKDLNRYIANNSLQNGSNEILYNRNKFGKDFPEHADFLVNEVIQVLKINNSKLDKGFLTEVDDKINKLDAPSEFRQKYFINLIALIGSVFIMEHAPYSSWKMTLSTDQITWYPDLLFKNNQIVFITYPYEDVFLYPDGIDDPLLNVLETIDGIVKINLRD